MRYTKKDEKVKDERSRSYPKGEEFVTQLLRHNRDFTEFYDKLRKEDSKKKVWGIVNIMADARGKVPRKLLIKELVVDKKNKSEIIQMDRLLHGLTEIGILQRSTAIEPSVRRRKGDLESKTKENTYYSLILRTTKEGYAPEPWMEVTYREIFSRARTVFAKELLSICGVPNPDAEIKKAIDRDGWSPVRTIERYQRFVRRRLKSGSTLGPISNHLANVTNPDEEWYALLALVEVLPSAKAEIQAVKLIDEKMNQIFGAEPQALGDEFLERPWLGYEIGFDTSMEG